MSARSVDEVRKELEDVAVRLWHDVGSEKEFLKRIYKYMEEMPEEDLWPLLRNKVAKELIRYLEREND